MSFLRNWKVLTGTLKYMAREVVLMADTPCVLVASMSSSGALEKKRRRTERQEITSCAAAVRATVRQAAKRAMRFMRQAFGESIGHAFGDPAGDGIAHGAGKRGIALALGHVCVGAGNAEHPGV